MEQFGPILVVGESLVDVVHHDGSVREQPGGSAANAAVALARLGERVLLATAVGPDARGQVLRSHLEREGVGWGCEPVALERTSLAEARIAPDGAADYTFRITWDLRPLLPDTPTPAAVLLSSLAPVLAPGAATVRTLLEGLAGRVPVAYDVNARPGITGTGPDVVAAIEATAARATLVKASDEDLAALWPKLGESAAAEHLLALGAEAVVVTRGAAGARWLDRGRTVDQPAVQASVVDTIGAGDTFGAALVSALLRSGALGRREVTDEQVREALAWAAAASSVVVARRGADPPTRAELLAR